MMACAEGSGIGAPNVPIILFTSLSHVAPGSGGCIVIYVVLGQIPQKLCTSSRPSPSASGGVSVGHDGSCLEVLHQLVEAELERSLDVALQAEPPTCSSRRRSE